MKDLIFLESIVKMPLMDLPVRAVCVNVGNSNILISPGSDLRSAQLASLPDVTDIVAPNLFHHSGVPKALRRHPKAKTWGAPGLAEKRPDIQWNNELNEEAWAYQDSLPIVSLAGMPKVNEVIFYHKQSSSIICTDLCFNLQDLVGIGPAIILSLFGTYRRFGVSRLFAMGIKDKSALELSLSHLFSLDFENIIVSHGLVVRGNGKTKLLAALKERGINP